MGGSSFSLTMMTILLSSESFEIRFGSAEDRAMLAKWPASKPRNWVTYVNEPASETELEALRRSCVRGAPYGSSDWVAKTAKKLGLSRPYAGPGGQRRRNWTCPCFWTLFLDCRCCRSQGHQKVLQQGLAQRNTIVFLQCRFSSS